jgi:hypothetical protein
VNDAGINKAVRNSANRAAETAGATLEAERRGSRLAADFGAMENDYRSFYYMLGDTQNKRLGATEESQQAALKLSIVLANDFEHPRWGTGKLVAAFSRNPNPYVIGPHYYTQVNFFGGENPAVPRFEKAEMFGMSVISEMTPQTRKGLRATQPGMILMPGKYTPDTVEELKVQLAAVLPDARETFNLLLAHACDPALNPDLAEAAQAYCDDLTGAG